jgi:hypothetical protein
MWRVVVGCALLSQLAPAEEAPRPPLREFIGLNGHTVQFRPELYRPVASKVRDYHPLDWDIGEETDHVPDYPWARNRVNWVSVYRPWVEAGFEIDACLMIQAIPPDSWRDVGTDAFRIGKAFAAFFGPSGEQNLVRSLEIGNEPGNYSDGRYREVFQAMARGVRTGDAAMQIVTCAAVAGESHDYAKSLDCLKGLGELYDVINVHTYAQIENWPTWRRSFPEDPRIEFLKDVEKVIAWRDQHAAGKKIWITEFGWDSTTKENASEGDFKDWVGNTDEEQAVYLVRSTLVFAGMDVERAYIYFFNDIDEPKLHAASGLTRNFVKKPSFFAMQWLQERLGNYRFVRAIAREAGRPWRFEFESISNPVQRVLAIWDPVEVGKAEERQVPIRVRGKVLRAEQLTIVDGEIAPVTVENGMVELGPRGYPVLVWFEH